LVPNPSFEIGSSCTNFLINSADGWCTAANSFGNCGYLNPCMSYSYAQAPKQYLDNCFKSYQTVRSGIAYAEFGIGISSSQQESARPMIKLIDTLEAGKIYCVTYYISMWNNAKYSFDKLGALLTPTPFPCSTPGGTVFPNIAGQYTPQVVSAPGVALEDTMNWMEISGSFIAIGDEAYLTLGDFFLQNQHYIKNSYPNCNGLAEYYVDDVSVEVVEIAKTKNDTLIYHGDSVLVGANNSEAALFSWQPTAGLSCTNCPNPKASPTVNTTYTVTKTQCKAVTSDVITITVSPTGINELVSANGFKISPNPTKDILNIDISTTLDVTKELSVKITDVLGKELLFTDYQKQINISQLEIGIYFISILQGQKTLVTKKVIKE
jgi:hypothetical protein